MAGSGPAGEAREKMHEELLLDTRGAATMRLVDSRWSAFAQRAFARMKSLGVAHAPEGSVGALVMRLKQTRPSTYVHCVRVARLARATGRAFGFDEARLKQLACTAMLHDIGKLLVPESIISRPRRPTPFDHFVVRLHPTFGPLIASYFNLSAELRVRTEHHHERWDGRG